MLSPWELLLWVLVWAFMSRASCSLAAFVWRDGSNQKHWRLEGVWSYRLVEIEMLQEQQISSISSNTYHFDNEESCFEKS